MMAVCSSSSLFSSPAVFATAFSATASSSARFSSADEGFLPVAPPLPPPPFFFFFFLDFFLPDTATEVDAEGLLEEAGSSFSGAANPPDIALVLSPSMFSFLFSAPISSSSFSFSSSSSSSSLSLSIIIAVNTAPPLPFFFLSFVPVLEFHPPPAPGVTHLLGTGARILFSDEAVAVTLFPPLAPAFFPPPALAYFCRQESTR
mmetsp:Transcript_27245/g.78550  ORF Transcript_27245/g.78550 Transcript_27245/m.78550 type:complete len:203 (+) Transcript_27245:204-812(+)